jgi:NADP-dependent 3-hydroxy acid dehydrogenase YdfG
MVGPLNASSTSTTKVAEPEAPVVAITGSSAGVGRAVAVAFGRRGWRVALLARGRDRLASARDEVQRAGGEGLVLPTDVANPDAVFEAAQRIVEEFGRIDVWINNAMATIYSPIDAISPAEFKRVTEVT